KTSLSYLPKAKKDELKAIVKTLLEFKEVEMIILFGSYATGKYVHLDRYIEDGITYVYQSDYDLLIILSQNKQADNINLVHGITEKLEQLKLSTPVSPIYEGAAFVNEQLSEGNYFFNDIKSEGVLLYTSKRKKLARKRKLSNEEIKKHAQDHFDDWFESAKVFYIQYENALKIPNLNNAAFQLHQATERYYHTLTLVFTGYKHKTHNLEELGKIASTLNLEYKKIFPRKTEIEKHHFSLLQKAYIDSRYKKGYRISRKELEYLSKRVIKLQSLTEKVCKAKIKSFTE
ncbi:MAG: HEPN domain-containing protein, partial [Victivallaceae bacterium]|nr:HEPN domain-containing protein [Victivallaceae bacterium]